MKVYEEVYVDDLHSKTHVMSSRWVDTMKPTVWRSKKIARSYEEHRDEGCFAAVTTIQGIRMLLARCLDKRDQGHEAFVADYTQAFLNAEVREGGQLNVPPPEEWTQKSSAGRKRPCWACELLRSAGEHLSKKLEGHGFKTSAIPCLFANTEVDICIGVHVDDMLVVGPSESTKILLQELTRERHGNALEYGH